MGTAVMEHQTEQAPAEHDRWDFLLRAWHEVDMPDGWRAEIREVGIVLVPPPAPRHNSNIYKIERQLIPRLPDDWELHQGTGVAIPSSLRLRAPDLVVVPDASIPEERGAPLSADDIPLVVEIASKGNADDDRGAKKHDYAAAGIPLYLLVDAYDPRGPRITLYSAPRGTDYADSHAVEWGEPIELPEPFELKLDTGGFLIPTD
jgi:Uma2 family endonuclease